MAFCTKCGSETREADEFCGKCGAPRAGAAAQPTETASTPTDRVAQIALKKEHNKLVVSLGMLGAVVSFICLTVLFVIADEMPRTAAGTFLALISLASAVFFVALFFPRFANSLNEHAASKKAIDPMTGKPLRMVWWFRWLAALIALTAFGGAGDYFSPPPTVADKPAAVAAAPASASDFDARLAKEKAKQAAETKAPITTAELRHGIDALCQATMQQVGQVMRGVKKADDTGPVIMLAAAHKILMDHYGDSDYRAIAILGAATKDMQTNDPNGNMVNYCMRHAGG